MAAFVTRDDAKKPIKRALGSLNQPTIIQLTVGLSHEYVSALKNQFIAGVKAVGKHNRLESRFRAQMHNWPTFVEGLRDLRQISEFPAEISGPDHILLNDDVASNALFELVLDRYDEPEVPDLDRFTDESAFPANDDEEFIIQPDDVTSAAEPMCRDRYPTPNLGGLRYAGTSCAFNRRACIQTQLEACERLPAQSGQSCYSLGRQQQRRRLTASDDTDESNGSLLYCPPCQRYEPTAKRRRTVSGTLAPLYKVSLG